MAVYGYGRVSTSDKGQSTDNQLKKIGDAGFALTHFFAEHGVSGSVKATNRPAFNAMMAKVAEGDTVIVTAVDRLGRNAVDVLTVVEEFKNRKVALRVMQFDGVDLTSPTGKLLVTVMAALAEMEKNLLIERTHDGLALAKERGKRLGRPMTIEPATMRGLAADVLTDMTLNQMASKWGIPRNTIHRNLKEWGSKLDEYAKEWATRKTQYETAKEGN